jgi:RimJ/RimL family protein N-acetyltransferase
MAGQEPEGSVPKHERPMLASGGVYLRPAERDDIPRFIRWLGDAETSTFLGQRAPLSQAVEERWFDKMVERHGTDLWYFVVCRRESGHPIGSVALGDLDHANGSAQLGIALGEDRGQGLGTDAMRAILDFGFGELRLERIWLDVYVDNDPAVHLYEKLGFVHEGTLRHAMFRAGTYCDIYRMAILRSEWPIAEHAGE